MYRGLGWCVPRTRPIGGTGLPSDLSTSRVLWGLPRVRLFNSAVSFLLSFFDARDPSPVITHGRTVCTPTPCTSHAVHC